MQDLSKLQFASKQPERKKVDEASQKVYLGRRKHLWQVKLKMPVEKQCYSAQRPLNKEIRKKFPFLMDYPY